MCNNHKISGMPFGAAHSDHENADAVVAAMESDLINTLAELVAIPSVSWPSHDAAHVQASARFTAGLLEDTDLFDTVAIVSAPVGETTTHGQPAVIARREPRGGGPTVMLYAHHDVQPAGDEDAWDTEPFVVSRVGERLFGRGVADDKAGVMSHVGALRALKTLRPDPDLGIVVFIEGEEEYGSPSFTNLLAAHRSTLASDVIIVADSMNWSTNIPALTTSLRGTATLAVTVSTLDHPLHSGMFGGAVPDAMMALTRLMASLHDDDGSVAVRGLVESHRRNSPDYDEPRLRDESGVLAGVQSIGHGDILERMWTRPAITVTGIDMPSVDEASNTLSASVRACVSIRVAPGQSTVQAAEVVTSHLLAHAPWGAHVSVNLIATGEGYSASTDSTAARLMTEAMRESWQTEPVEMGIGGSIPFIAEFLGAFPGAEILITGIEDPDTRAHSPNESLHLPGFLRATGSETRFLVALNDGLGW
jgi:acetylornithine deacetylase/succinyl-diaminopimelate desuccinylase-like protein